MIRPTASTATKRQIPRYCQGSQRTARKGQPVLIGTVSIEKNEKLGNMLKKAGVPHQVLNAKNNEREAKIVSAAG